MVAVLHHIRSDGISGRTANEAVLAHAVEHAKMQMIQGALAGTAEREDEHALDKIGRMRNADKGRIGIELPPLNTTLVEVHRELATV